MIAVDLQLYYSLCVPRRMLFSSGTKWETYTLQGVELYVKGIMKP